MSTGRNTRPRRKAAPTEFVDHPDIPQDLPEAEAPPENEEELMAAVAASDSGDESESVDISSEPEEEAPPPKPSKSKVAAKPKAPRGKRNAAASKDDEEDASGSEAPDRRVFKVLPDKIIPEDDSPAVDSDDLSAGGGRYSGKNPMQAAKKAFTKICKASGQDQCTYIFTIQEIAQGKTKKTFTYRGVRQKLDEPLSIAKGETSFTVNFSTTVRAYRPDAKPKAKPAPKAKAAPKPKAAPKAKTPSKPKAPRGRPKKEAQSTPPKDGGDDMPPEVPAEPAPVKIAKKTVPPRRGRKSRAAKH